MVNLLNLNDVPPETAPEDQPNRLLNEYSSGFFTIMIGRAGHPVLLGGISSQPIDLMGMTKADIRSRFDDIVGFAGVEAFLDMPVKRYSTGMRARLGFSVATSVEADVLLVDEVLSVGDFEFQRRSLERIRAMCDGGAALILVSHNLWSINSLCSRALLLDHGRVLVDGTPAEAIDRYMAELGVTELDPERGASFEEFEVPEVLRGRVVIEEIEALPPVIRSGDPVTIRAVINVVEPCDAVVVMSLFTSERAVYAERELGPDGWAAEPGRYVVEAAIEAVPLSPGRFQFRVAVLPEDDRHLDRSEELGHGGVVVGHPHAGVDDEQHDIGLAHGLRRLLRHLAVELGTAGHPPARVDQSERATQPVGLDLISGR
jgi:hypothetical protein